MKIAENEIYRLKTDAVNNENLSNFVRVSGIENKKVIGAPMYGGFQLKIPQSEFIEKFAHVPAEELNLLKNTYQEKYFDFDEWNETIPAWSNGDLWNGWGCPYFERETIEKAIESGLLGNDVYTKLIIRDEGAYSVMTMSGELPQDFDWSAIEAKLRAGEEVYKFEIAPGVSIEGNFFAKETIIVDGREIETYPVGAGYWTWNQYDEPQVHNSPTL